MGVLPAQGFIKVFVLFLLVGESLANKGKLSVSYYDSTCPQADELVYQAVKKAAMGDQKAPARLLRMFFHDCFIRSGGPHWKVLKGRKDGRVSIAAETKELPPPNSTVTKLIQSFAKKGLSVGDLVALSGAHTLGVSRCTSFSSRINTGNVDPAMDSKFAMKLQGECSMLNAASGNTVFLDATAVTFDNNYYKRLTRGKGVLTSDQDLYNDARTRELVNLYGRHKGLFFSEFAASMVRMGNIGVEGEDGEVRLNCRVVN
ncbi:Peroxidase 66 [Nymphaea thermarum]|nr:Peroxidase 66 [Nymphaea thermarum]